VLRKALQWVVYYCLLYYTLFCSSNHCEEVKKAKALNITQVFIFIFGLDEGTIMVKTGIITDVHGCYDALAQVIKRLRDYYKVDRYVWLGDVVGYGPDPRKCYEVAVNFTGRASNRYVLRGNHDGYFGTGDFSIAGGFARASIEWAWINWLGIKDPQQLDEAIQRLEEGVVEGVNIEEEKKSQGLWAWAKGLVRRKRKDYVPAKDLKNVLKSAAKSDNAPVISDFFESEKKKGQVKGYLLFFENLGLELPLDGNLLFAHSFPKSLAEYADELGIQKELIDTAEIYVRSQADYDKRCAEKAAEGKEESWKRSNITIERLIEKVPEGTTLFLGHNHKRVSLEDGDRKIVIPGAVFDRAAVEGDPTYDIAQFAVHDSETKGVILDGIKYDRKGVDERMRNECGFGRFMEAKTDE
jgi:predicted phosphodiesterase